MRIALVYLGRRGSGGPISYHLAKHLSAHAEVVPVVSGYAESIGMWRNSHLSVLEVNTYRSPTEAAWSMVDWRKHRHLKKRILEQNPDVLFFPMLQLWAPITQWSLRTVPSVVTIHDPEPHPGLLDHVGWWWSKLSVRLATRTVILSNGLASSARRMGASADSIDVIPHGELSYYSDLSEGVETRQDSATTLLFFGRITSYKGLEVLLKAFEIVEAETNARLLIVGAGNLSPYQESISALPRVKVVNEWIPESQVDAYFRQADIVVAPYTSGTQSGVISIAMSLGKPIIASAVGGIPEQIEHMKTGILVQPGAVEELTQACLRLLLDASLATQLGNAAQRRSASQFGWSSIAKQVLESCELALQRQGRS